MTIALTFEKCYQLELVAIARKHFKVADKVAHAADIGELQKVCVAVFVYAC